MAKVIRETGFVKRRRKADGVYIRVCGLDRLESRLGVFVVGQYELVVQIPRQLVLGHPERLDDHTDLRPLVVVAAIFIGRAAHFETAAGDRDHVEPEGLVATIYVLGVCFDR